MENTDKKIGNMEGIVREKSNTYLIRIPRNKEEIFRDSG